MKKIKSVLSVFVLAGLTLVSCSSDDSSAPAGTLEGKWNQTKTVVVISGTEVVDNYDDHVAGCTKNYSEFAASGVYNDVVFFKQGGTCNESAADPGTWVKTDNKVTLTNAGELTGTYTITALTNSELRISKTTTDTGIESTTTVYFTRAANQ